MRKKNKPVLANKDQNMLNLYEEQLIKNFRVSDTNDYMDTFCLDFDFVQGEKIENLFNIFNKITEGSFLFESPS